MLPFVFMPELQSLTSSVRIDGGVVKLQGPFGAKTLFVYDPKALHHIIVKDQHIFEETTGFIL